MDIEDYILDVTPTHKMTSLLPTHPFSFFPHHLALVISSWSIRRKLCIYAWSEFIQKIAKSASVAILADWNQVFILYKYTMM